MRRSHRRLHFWIWLIVLAGIVTLGTVVLNQSRPDTVESYKPISQ